MSSTNVNEVRPALTESHMVQHDTMADDEQHGAEKGTPIKYETLDAEENEVTTLESLCVACRENVRVVHVLAEWLAVEPCWLQVTAPRVW